MNATANLCPQPHSSRDPLYQVTTHHQLTSWEVKSTTNLEPLDDVLRKLLADHPEWRQQSTAERFSSILRGVAAGLML